MKPLVNLNYLGHTRAWWVIMAVGIMFILGGFAYWFWPAAGYAVASQLFGWLLILAGVVQLCIATGPHHGKGRGWWIAGGIIDMFIGFMLVRSVILSEAVFPYFLAILFIFWGAEAFVSACYRRDRRYWWLGIINGILLCLIGCLFLEAGYISNMMMVSFLTSIAFIYWGFTLSIASLEMKPVEIARE